MRKMDENLDIGVDTKANSMSEAAENGGTGTVAYLMQDLGKRPDWATCAWWDWGQFKYTH